MSEINKKLEGDSIKILQLNPDQSPNPYTWRAPINWNGTLGGSKLRIIQNDVSSSMLSSFDFIEPIDLDNEIKELIIREIDFYLKLKLD